MPKDTIHAKGLEIGIYTNDFNNEFISLTDIARYKSDDPNVVLNPTKTLNFPSAGT